jgi:NADH dehydrogenase FAD-containing subunit
MNLNYFIDEVLHPEGKKEKDRKSVVVVGGGWGGMSCIKELDTNRYDVTLISPQSYFVFTPLLVDYTFGNIDASRYHSCSHFNN